MKKSKLIQLFMGNTCILEKLRIRRTTTDVSLKYVLKVRGVYSKFF